MAEQSRNEEILRATIDGDEYTKTPQSREEELLLELKQTIEAGGGASVVPNPEGEATETLTKLGINDKVYGIPSGGGGSCKITTYTVGSFNPNSSALSLEDTTKAIQDIQDGNIPIFIGTDKKVYYYWGLTANNPFGTKKIYFCLFGLGMG